MNPGYNATVLQVELPTPYLMRLRVQPDFPIPDYRPGQYFTLGLAYSEPRLPGFLQDVIKEGFESRILKRPYSLSDPLLNQDGELFTERPPYLEFYIALVTPSAENPAPALTPRLFGLKSGARLFLSERAMGHYTIDLMDSAASDGVVFCSTGTGEAPHNVMIRSLLTQGYQKPVINLLCSRLSAGPCLSQGT